ncbi:MAG: hypothetical protein IJW08_04105 [Lentisphaeria bacterium]|nr:hypothetical protein [Lentisphaeria bacterium]
MSEDILKRECDCGEDTFPQSRFIRIGGSYQPVISSSSDFPALLALDDAHWEVISLTVSSLRTDKRFLDFLDSDKNGLIRTDEVRNALRFLQGVFKDMSGVDTASDVLELDHLDLDSQDGIDISAAARTMLAAIGKPEATSITLQEISNDAEIKKCAICNGDGVIVAAEDDESASARVIRAVAKTSGAVQDLSGNAGINGKELADFVALANAYIAWLDDGKARYAELNPFGAETPVVAALAAELKTPVEKFFLSSSAVAFFEDDPDRLAKKDIVADIRLAGDVNKLLDETAIAAPDKSGVLRRDAVLNPRWSAKFRQLCATESFAEFLKDGALSEEMWKVFLSRLAPREAYMASNPAAGKFDDFTPEALKELISDESISAVQKLIQQDVDAGCALAGSSKLLKAVLYQRYILEFLNNYANLTELFSVHRFSMLQTGILVMDGRHFTLAVPVTNVAEHKKIVTTSNICVAYVEVSGGAPGAVTKQTLAVAITNGSMSNLFPGKRGVFFSADGKTFDAKVIDFIEQPVSIPDALKKPFLNLGQFISKQFDKLVTTQAGSVQKDLGNQLSSGKPIAPPAAGNNGTMLLMSGGIGLAALGSSVAFIAKSLQNVSLLTILGVLLGIIVVFGGPCVAISLTKLYKRDLARFLEAAGCAINHKMRLTFKLGLFFTFTPCRPGSVGEELFEKEVNKKFLTKPSTLFLIVLTALVFGAAGFYGGLKLVDWHERRAAAIQEKMIQEQQQKNIKKAESAAAKKVVPAAPAAKK